MKGFIVSVLATLPILFFEMIASIIYSIFVQGILAKDPIWKRCLGLWVGLLLVQTGIYTWVPGKLGLVVRYFDGLIQFVDGALITNLSLVMFLHAGGIGLAMLGYLWKVIRKQVKFNGKYVLLELAMTAILVFLGVRFRRYVGDQVEVAEKGKISAFIVLGVILSFWGGSGLKTKVLSKKKYNTVFIFECNLIREKTAQLLLCGFRVCKEDSCL